MFFSKFFLLCHDCKIFKFSFVIIVLFFLIVICIWFHSSPCSILLWFFYDFRLNMLTDWNMKRLNFFIFYWYIKPRISTYHFESFSVAIMLRATTVTNVFPFIIANAIFFNPINTMYSTCGVRDIYSSRATGSNSWLLVWFVLLMAASPSLIWFTASNKPFGISFFSRYWQYGKITFEAE